MAKRTNPVDQAESQEIADLHDGYVSVDDLETKGFGGEWSFAGDGASGVGTGLWSAELRAFADAQTIKSVYFTEDWLFITIDRGAQKISSLPLIVTKRTIRNGKPSSEQIERPAVRAIFENPNPYQDYTSWMYCVVSDLDVLGNAMTWFAPASRQLVHMPGELVRMEFDGRGQLREYQLYQNGFEDNPSLANIYRYDPRQIIHVRRPNPSSMMWGLSPIIPGTKSILFNRYSSEFLTNFYIKGAQPGLALEMGKEANEKTALRLLRSMEAAYTGRKNQRKNLIIPKGVTIKEVTQRLSDQQLVDHLDKNRETLINLYGVPKHELGLDKGGSLGSDDYRVALRNWWDGPLKSKMTLIAGSLTRMFRGARLIAPDEQIEFDTSGVEALQENKKEKAELATAMLTTHTLNQVRAEVYDDAPLPGGDALPGGQPSAQPVFGALPAAGAPALPGTAPLPGAQPALPPADGATPAAAVAAATTSPQAALNGSQVTSLLEIVTAVAGGQIPRDTAVAMIQVSFALSESDANRILSSVGQGFKPTAPEPPPPTVAPPGVPPGKSDQPPAQAESEADKNAPEATEKTVDDPRTRNIEAFGNFKSQGTWWEKREGLINAATEKGSDRIKRRADNLLAKQASSAVRVVRAHLAGKKKGVKAPGDDETPDSKELRKRILEALKKLEASWVAGSTDDLKEIIELGYDAQLEIPFNTPNRSELEALRERNANGRRAILEQRQIRSFSQMSQTTTERIMKIVEDGVANSSTIQDISKAIQEEVGIGGGRSDIIARTETLGAVSAGQAAAMQDAAEVIPNLKKMWINAGDERVRGNPSGKYADADANHWELQGVIVDHDEPFVDPTNGDKLMYPRDPAGSAASTIACRCSFIMVPAEDAERLGLSGLNTESDPEG